MSRQRVWLPGLMLLLATATVFCRAEEPRKEMTATEKAKLLSDLALADELVNAGRKAGSPEALLGAAKVLARLNGAGYKLVKLEGVQPIAGKVDETPTTTGEPIKEEGGTERGFSDQIKALKEEAHKLNSGKVRDEKLDELIDKVSEASRGSLAGPRTLGPFDIGPGATNTFHFTFKGDEEANVLVTNQGRGQLKLEIFNERGFRVTSIAGAGELSCDWTPKMTRPFTVTVSNVGNQMRSFTLYKN